MLSESDFEVAPCLGEGPIADAAQSAVLAAKKLGVTRWASLARAWSVPYLFGGMERVFASGQEPVGAINDLLENLAKFLNIASNSGFVQLGNTVEGDAAEQSETFINGVEELTADHYGQLFGAFSSTSFWDEPVRLLRERLDRNSIDISLLKGKEVLDAGCGGGRYSVAWRLLGAKRVVGIDISALGISDAKQRIAQAGTDGVILEQGDVLALPFEESSFDIVSSNGVLHHTVDWKSGVSEVVRVLKPGGLGWLYLIEKPGGLFWDVIEILRMITKDVGSDTARSALQILGIPANRIFYMLDHVLVPINVRLSTDQVEECLVAAGATEIRRLSRGTNFDRIERIHQGEPFASLKYGVGENRYVFSKG